MKVFNVPYRLFMFALLTVSTCFACLFILVVNMPILNALEARGIHTQAEVLSITRPYVIFQRGNYSRIGWRQDMRYGYLTQAGDWIEDEKTLVKQNARTVHVGRQFDLVYLPDRPHVHDSDLGNGYGGMGMLYALSIMSLFCAGLSVILARRLPEGWGGPKLWPPLSNLAGEL